jgi:hypothetical protein
MFSRLKRSQILRDLHLMQAEAAESSVSTGGSYYIHFEKVGITLF